MYDESGGGEKFREFASINLAWWHTFKHCGFQIWKRFAATLWAPLWHHLYPSTSFFVKPSSFASIQSNLQCLLLSYPKWKNLLKIQLDRTLDIRGETRIALLDLQFLLEFAIPSVRHMQQTFASMFSVGLHATLY